MVFAWCSLNALLVLASVRWCSEFLRRNCILAPQTNPGSCWGSAGSGSRNAAEGTDALASSLAVLLKNSTAQPGRPASSSRSEVVGQKAKARKQRRSRRSRGRTAGGLGGTDDADLGLVVGLAPPSRTRIAGAIDHVHRLSYLVICRVKQRSQHP